MTQTPLKLQGCSFKNIQFRNEVSRDIESLIIDASVVVCGAGQTSVEAAISGTPFIATILADNQLKNAHALKELGCLVFDKFDPKQIALHCENTLRNNNNRSFELNYASGLENVVNVAKKGAQQK